MTMVTRSATAIKNTKSFRSTALAVGILYILGTATGIVGKLSTSPYFQSADYPAAVAVNPIPVICGALFTLTMGLALAFIPLLLYPVLKRQNQILALGYLVFRGALETTLYIVTAVCWLLSVGLCRAAMPAGLGSGTTSALCSALIDPRTAGAATAIFFLGGAVMFYTALYRSALVPRWIPLWGLVAAVPYLAASLMALFGLIAVDSLVETLMYLPMGLQEMVLAAWLIAKGFRPIDIPCPSC